VDATDVRAERTKQRIALHQRLASELRFDLAARLAKCGQDLILVCTGCTKTRTAKTRCDLKWCPSCQHALAARTADRYARIMGAIQWPLRVTLTAQNYGYDEPNGIRQLRRAWGKLRRLRWFRAKVVGGVTAFEVTDTGKGYHFHAHALFDCRWLSVTVTPPKVGATKEEWRKKAKAAATEVGQQWSLCCGRPASVQVRRVWTADKGDIGPALAETLKYSVKGSDLVECDHAIGPLIDELDATRMITSFGSCFGRPEFKRRRSVPAACDCGCQAWLPEEVMIAQVRAESRRYGRRRR